ncbi:hypothetical protein ABT084_21055 [Streptomyces sp. NPDC002138]|uniref:hypothetical protein n=1 Tax=Streptomyces sp. NPDC002138 TaxID=3154410 RepID=UPI0033230CA6
MSDNNAARPGQWYFDTRTESVAEEPGPDRLGPYPTRQEAASAMQTVNDRNKQWREDPHWNDDVDGR